MKNCQITCLVPNQYGVAAKSVIEASIRFGQGQSDGKCTKRR